MDRIRMGTSYVHLSTDAALNADVDSTIRSMLNKGYNNDIFPEWKTALPSTIAALAAQTTVWYTDISTEASRMLLLFYRFTIKGVRQKVCVLRSADTVYIVPVIGRRREFFDGTLIECVYQDSTKTLNVVDILWYHGQPNRYLHPERWIHCALITLVLLYDDEEKPVFNYRAVPWREYNPASCVQVQQRAVDRVVADQSGRILCICIVL